MILREFLPQNEECFRNNILSSTAINSSIKRKKYEDLNSGVVTLTEETQHKIDWSLFKEPTGLIPFSENLKRIEAFLKTMGHNLRKTGYSIGDEKNEIGKNEGTLKVLLYAILNDLTVGETLNLFSEHFRDVAYNSESGRHGNIRALEKYGLDIKVGTLYINGEIRFDELPIIFN